MVGRLAGALVLAGLSGLAGCTPQARPVIAVGAVDGRPTAYTVSCADTKVDSVRVEEVAGDQAVAQWHASTDTAAGPERITLLQAPDGWTVPTRTLTEFRPGRQYVVFATAHGDDAGTVYFTMEQVAGLRAGQVLVKRGQVVAEQDFRDAARKAC